MDPRGAKLGGIETHVRLVLARHPADMEVLFVGIDELGDLPEGQISEISVAGRRISFLPVARMPSDELNRAARALSRSATLRCGLGALRHALTIRRWCRQGPGRATADLQRFEFAMLTRALGLPTVQMVHGEGSREDKMDSLIKKYWFLHAMNERIALTLASRILCVNPTIVKRIERLWPTLAPKAEVMTVSVDPVTFPMRPFDTADGIFRVVFAGRFDAFKDPPLMFRALERLHGLLRGQLEFHYIGSTDPHRYGGFAAIEGFTVRHGIQNAAGVSAIMARCHAGVLTSFFEGMPCYLLEALSVGRPFVAIRLPQFDPLVRPGISGTLIERSDPQHDTEALAGAFAALWADIRAGRIDPAAVHALTRPYQVDTQMQRLFDHHRRLGAGHVLTLAHQSLL
jgi:glycosyltransferase involved in cell wall biosynthesis